MNPKNHLINDYLKTLSENLTNKGYDNEDSENILSALEAQLLELGGGQVLTKPQELEIINSLSSVDSYPDCCSDQEKRREGASTQVAPSTVAHNVKLIKALYISIPLVCLIMLFIWGIKTQRRLVTYDENVNATQAQVDNVLQRRYDLIPNLVNTVKGYTDHEKELFTEIARLRSSWSNQSGEERQKTGVQLEGSISKLMLVVESYPAIQSDQMYQNLLMSLEGTENRIAVERMRYNESIREFNAEIKKMPQTFVASWMGLSKKNQYLKAEEKAHTVPKVNF